MLNKNDWTCQSIRTIYLDGRLSRSQLVGALADVVPIVICQDVDECYLVPDDGLMVPDLHHLLTIGKHLTNRMSVVFYNPSESVADDLVKPELRCWVTWVKETNMPQVKLNLGSMDISCWGIKEGQMRESNVRLFINQIKSNNLYLAKSYISPPSLTNTAMMKYKMQNTIQK